ncbi:fatty acid desaturase [Robbsia andropogonis]|uniref:fatty acid desaturase n=1 Tax=Robbsia andropogonis TaxID=28092 RepID=UPI003D1DDEC8
MSLPPPAANAAQLQRHDRANLLIVGLQTCAWAGTLTWLSRTDAGPIKWLLLVPFCLMMQGVFSMMHECFHGSAHQRPTVNYTMMLWASTMFGAAATLIHVNHLGHHVRNRTNAERADFALCEESLARKRIEYYLAILGGIWISACVGSIVLSLLPTSVTERWSTHGSDNTYAIAFGDFSAADFRRVRAETLGIVIIWLVLGCLLGWSPIVVLISYAAFAFSWSSMQWIYHMRTPLDVVEGTYNLRAPRLVRLLLLNFNYNLTHHRHPALRWQQLHLASDPGETRPIWYSWLSIFLPPRRLPDDLSQLDKTYF